MLDPVLGPVTVGPLCRGNLVGGLAEVIVSLMGSTDHSPTQDVQVEDNKCGVYQHSIHTVTRLSLAF